MEPMVSRIIEKGDKEWSGEMNFGQGGVRRANSSRGNRTFNSAERGGINNVYWRRGRGK